jgi:LPXTG-motif cell wall-anchored protein
VVTDPLCDLTFQSGDDGNGDVDVGETWVYRCTYSITEADVRAGTVTNTVSVAVTGPGGTEVLARGQSSAVITAKPETVPPPTTVPPPPGPTIPRTGADVAPPVAVAAGLILIGLGATMGSRRPRKRWSHRSL